MSEARPLILLVDDDEVDRRIVRRAFRGTELEAHSDVTEAETAAEAMELIRGQSWDCILLDNGLPGTTGVDLLQQLSGPDGEIDAPVVMLTGAQDLETAVRAMRLGARDYLVKDAKGRYQRTIASVIQRVVREEHIRRARKAAEEELRAHRTHLEALVSERTAALRVANQRLEDDIVQRKQAEQALYEEKQRVEVTLQSIGDAVLTTDATARVNYINRAAEHLIGCLLHEVQGRMLNECVEMLHEDGSTADLVALVTGSAPTGGYYLIRRRDGRELTAAVTPSAICTEDGRLAGMVLVIRDVTEERNRTDQLAYQARHDSLTGLVNRREFEQRLGQAMESVESAGSEHVLFFLDLDGFKQVNDSAGHLAGDELLRQVALRLEQEVRRRDTVARLGGDEFSCLLEHCELEQGVALATDMLKAVQDVSLVSRGKCYRVGVSIGIVHVTQAAFQQGLDSVPELMNAADSACYAAKAAGRGQLQVYHVGTQREQPAAQEHWGNRIILGMTNNELALFRQPISTIGSEAPIGYEILLRLWHQNRWLEARHFMPAVERYRFSPRLDRWVIHETLRHLAAEGDAPGERDPVYFINISEPSLSDPAFGAYLQYELSTHRVCPARLGFELKESALLNHYDEALAFAVHAKALGCHIALDDFADALSLMHIVQPLAPDFLKIRGKLIEALHDDPLAPSIIESISRVGHAASIATLAQWPATAEAVSFLSLLGVDLIQGDWLRRPQPMPISISASAGP